MEAGNESDGELSYRLPEEEPIFLEQLWECLSDPRRALDPKLESWVDAPSFSPFDLPTLSF